MGRTTKTALYNYSRVPLYRGPIFNNITYDTAMAAAERIYQALS